MADRSIRRDRSESPARSVFGRRATPVRTLSSPPLTHEEADELTSPYRDHSGYTYANSLIYRSSLADSDIYEIPYLARGPTRRPEYTFSSSNGSSFQTYIVTYISIVYNWLASAAQSGLVHSTSLLVLLFRLIGSILSIPVYISILLIGKPIYVLTRFLIHTANYVRWQMVSALQMAPRRHVRFSPEIHYSPARAAEPDAFLDEPPSHSFFTCLVEFARASAAPSAPWSLVRAFIDEVDWFLQTVSFFPPPFERFLFQSALVRRHREVRSPEMDRRAFDITSALLDHARMLRARKEAAEALSEDVRRKETVVDQTITVSNGSPTRPRIGELVESATVKRRAQTAEHETEESARRRSRKNISHHMSTSHSATSSHQHASAGEAAEAYGLRSRTPPRHIEEESSSTIEMTPRRRGAVQVKKGRKESEMHKEAIRLVGAPAARSLGILAGDTDDEGFASGDERPRPRRSSLKKYVSKRSFWADTREFCQWIVYNIFDFFKWILYTAFSLIVSIPDRARDVILAPYLFITSKLLSPEARGRSPTRAGYELRTRRARAAGDAARASTETSNTFFLTSILNNSTSALSSGSKTVLRGADRAVRSAGGLCCRLWWLLPLLLLLLLIALASKDPQVHEQAEKFVPRVALEAVESASGRLSAIGDSVSAFFSGCRSLATAAFTNFVQTGQAVIYVLTSGFTQAVTYVVTGTADFVSSAYVYLRELIGRLLCTFFSVLLSFVYSAADIVQSTASFVWVWLCSVGSSIAPSGSKAASVVGALLTPVKDAGALAFDFLKLTVNTVVSSVLSVATLLGAFLSSLKPPPAEPGMPIIKPVPPIQEQPIIIQQDTKAAGAEISMLDIDAKIRATVASLLESQVSQIVEKRVNLLLAEIRTEYMAMGMNASTKNDAELAAINAQLKALQDIKVSLLEKQQTGQVSFDWSNLEAKINAAILKYNSDRTGIPDYALESAGGSVVSTRCSETYPQASRLEKLFNIPLWYSNYGPRTVIQRSSPALVPGECWAFSGGVGFLTIRLARPIRVTAISYEHVSRDLTPDGQILSAPKELTFFAYRDVADIQSRVKLGDFVYRDSGESLQFFDITADAGFAVEYVELQVDSNYGAPFTCLYRLRVHGRVDASEGSTQEHDEL